MSFLRDLLSRFRGNPGNSGTSQQEGPPSPQAALVSSAFLRHSRDFYDSYEDIQEQIAGEHHDLDKAVLFESMAFFLFILDFDLFHSEQTEKTNDYIFLVCERLVIHAYTGYQGTHFGSPEQIHNSIQHRIRKYAESLRDKNLQDPAALLTGWHNPIVNNMEAARDADTIGPEDAPLIIGDAFDRAKANMALSAACLATVCPFHFGLQELFRGNQDFLRLSEEEGRDRLSRGASKAQELKDEHG